MPFVVATKIDFTDTLHISFVCLASILNVLDDGITHSQGFFPATIMFATIISPFCYLLSFPDLSLYCSLSSGMVSDVCFFDDVSSLNLFSLLCVELLAVGFIRYFISFLMILFLD